MLAVFLNCASYGVSMPEDIRQGIFELFTTKASGRRAGLGLAAV